MSPTAAPAIGEVELVIRPVRIRWVAWALAAFLFLFFAAGAALVYVESAGFNFRPADQVAMLVLGALLAGGALLFARPRLRAGAGGVEVRTSLQTKILPWAWIEGVSFPDGAQFARLDLPDDEYQTVAALQAVDREHAVRGVTALRELYARYGSAAPR